MASTKLDICLVSVFIWLSSFVCSATADICSDGSYCDFYCCNDGYGSGDYCCYNVAFSWWFWFMWGLFLLFVFISCCAIIKRRQVTRQRQVIVVQQDCQTTPGYGTLTNAQGPPLYVHPGTGYNQYGYPNPPPGPAPLPVYQPIESLQPVQQVQAYPSNKPDEVPHNPNEKPPAYNPYSQ